MDTSKEYTEMCRLNEDIQIKWNPIEGDVYFTGSQIFITGYVPRTHNGRIVNSTVHLTYSQRPHCRDSNELTWLPRQDQLQGILGHGTLELALDALKAQEMLVEIHWNASEERTLAEIVNSYSMEQLWLVFVMKEKYNKTWDGSSWRSLEASNQSSVSEHQSKGK